MKMISKKLKLRKYAGLLLAVVSLSMFYSCSDNDDPNEETARVMVHLTDAPGDFDNVFVDVIDVKIHAEAGANGEEGWTSLGNVRTGTYDLLQLTGGVTELLADAHIPAGHLGQLRLVLGNNNTVVVNGESQPLSTPSAQQSGLKLHVNQNLEAGREYEFLMDFDVEQSIVTAGSSGGYLLRPVIRLSDLSESGKISGEVHPSAVQGIGVQTLVRATNANHTISTYTNSQGAFVLHGVPQGVYRVTVTPAASSGLGVYTRNNVEVTGGATVDMETIYLQ